MPGHLASICGMSEGAPARTMRASLQLLMPAQVHNYKGAVEPGHGLAVKQFALSCKNGERTCDGGECAADDLCACLVSGALLNGRGVGRCCLAPAGRRT